MLEDQRPGAAYWIDHYVVPTADADRWGDFYTKVLGAVARVEDEPRRAGRPGGVTFTDVGKCHVGASAAEEALAAVTFGPCYSWFIRPEEINEHLQRLDANGIAHSGPVTAAEQGEAGTAIRFADPDGNPLEFWAPERMPDGGMDNESSAKVGRIAAATFESRDLDKTRDFYGRYCGLDPLSGSAGEDSVVFPLAAAGRLVFKKVDQLGVRTGGHGVYRALHTALVVRADEFQEALDRMYRDLPEWDYDPALSSTFSVEDAEALPARTGIHGNPIGPQWKRDVGRGDSFYDWDTNVYHFVAGAPIDGSMARFQGVSQRKFLEERRRSAGV